MADERKNFLDTVEDQIAYRPVRKTLSKELEEHILDHMEDYQREGYSRQEAEELAVRAMGDPIVIGTELNAVHRIQKAPGLMAFTLLLLVSGFGASAYMRWSPEQAANGFLYYVPGALVLFLMSWKGYPLVIRYGKWLLPLVGGLLLVGQVFSIRGLAPVWQLGYFRYFGLLLAGPVLILLAYRLRRYGGWTVLLVLGLSGICCGLPSFFDGGRDLPACLILAVSVGGALLLMIHREVFSGGPLARRRLYGIGLAGLVLVGSFFVSTQARREVLQWFLQPDAYIHSTWEDTYNSALIRKMIRETPLARGVDLTPQELMDYGTGAWYFAERDPRQIGIYAVCSTKEEEEAFQALIDERREAGANPRYIHYDESEVTLWDVLPQHYHNNYRIAVCILLFGKLAGIGYLAVIGVFYLLLFGCIGRIQGRLAFSISCCCGICLLAEGILYVLGNFGYQYGAFTNLPLIAEGRMSILVNMALLGFIFSAYRYDRVEMEGEASFCGVSFR